jgi:hypothetical protein
LLSALHWAMCRYGYSYFASCRHHKTILYEFCENAQPTEGKFHLTSAVPSHDGHRAMEAVAWEAGVARVDDIPNTTDNNNLKPSSSLDLPTSHLGKGSTPVIAEPSSEPASLPSAAEPPPHHPDPVSSHDMAGFSLIDFRQWMSGTAGVSAQTKPACGNLHSHDTDTDIVGGQDAQGVRVQDYASAADMPSLLEQHSPTSLVPQVRKRQDGIRENTDESCHLPPR